MKKRNKTLEKTDVANDLVRCPSGAIVSKQLHDELCIDCADCDCDDDDASVVELYPIESQAEIDKYPPFPFPNLCGKPTPSGWEEVRDLFCDASGCGGPGEPALTIEQLKRELRPGFAYAITGEGQFQVYVTEYKRSRA
jgi:hypothetical protein